MPVRLKGQETSITVTSTTNGVEPAFSDIKSAEIVFDRDILSEGYLGQTTEQKDDIFKGLSGNVTFHNQSADIVSLFQRMNEVSKRRLPGESITIITTLRFPVGGTRRIVIPDAKFGNIPINIGGRGEYVEFKLEFAADDGNFIAG